MQKVTESIAKKEVEKWLDFKKVSSRKREEYKAYIEALTYAVQDGDLILNEDNSFTQVLKFPLGDGSVKELTYKPRVTVSELRDATKGLAAGDAEGRLAAYCAALTNQPKGVFYGLDSEDNGIAQAIAIFFI
jgi:hypothetical protein